MTAQGGARTPCRAAANEGMNRILFETSEIADGIATFGGERAEHILNVLHGEVGQIIKTGEIDGPVGTSEIIEISNPQPQPNASAETKSSATISVRIHHAGQSITPWIDLILAPPRPRVMKRLLPQLATMGVGRIVLVGAQKVEKDFWGATLLKEANYRPLLVDGLMQGGTSILPKLECWKSFNRFVREGLSAFATANRIVAHPYVARGDARGADVGRERERPLLAIGPEGGWTDDEVARLVENGFRGYSLGSRILRTDTATVALLAQLMPEYDTHRAALENQA